MNRISKEVITETALKLFREKGYDQVSVQEICEENSISKPTFYHYVDSKESLILDVYGKILKDLFSHTYELLLLNSSYEQLIFIFGKLVRETEDMRPDLVSKLLIANLKKDHESFAMREGMTRLCVTILKQAQEKGEIHNSCDAATLYNGIAHMFTGYTTLWCITKGSEDSFRLFFKSLNDLLIADDALKDLYLKYISAPPVK